MKSLESFVSVLEKFSKNMLKRNKGLAVRPAIAGRIQRIIAKEYTKTKSNYASGLISNMNDFMGGKINMDDYLLAQKSLIHQSFKDAYQYGKWFGSGKPDSLDDTERRFVVYQTTKEMDFMKKFAADISSGAGKMPYDRRMKMYSDSLNAMFGFGRLVYMPEDVRIYWILGATDKHCLDCLLISSKNPYTKKTLPAFPKSGGSVCLSNCRCEIRYYYGNAYNSSDYENYILDRKNIKDGADIPTEDQYKHYMDQKEEYYYNRLMYSMTGEVGYKKKSDDIKRAFNQFKKTNNLYMPEIFPIKDSINELNAFKNNKAFEFMGEDKRVSIDDFLSIFIGNEQKYAKVVNITGEYAIVHFLDNTQLSINPRNYIIFRERR